MYRSQQIADWFIAQNRAELRLDDSAEPITNMKLQKLMYFAQGICLAVHDKRLFDDQIYAFKHGPVVKGIREKYRGKYLPELTDQISDQRAIELADNFDLISTDQSASEVLNITWQKYGKYTASYLRELSHDQKGPWEKSYCEDKEWIKIDNQEIKNYFKEYIICQ
ncbi:Panacea domain-containing protein [Xylocopilactobacillus apicola]|uniref:Antitoxin SocA-like Panacea domain-containing protein n=1 Tax=Xylocopilactobacillus apicola TaxID=2932184 RepID=A0AAU9CZ93_9LACO|nr:type II toxin-antitoxin system antitoxin SocA domain-containing protein [Xylocopilactobacillus apicola]BDR59347.1 hypothetical protein XA3_17880 [Xylocopilactobacillus apicola]